MICDVREEEEKKGIMSSHPSAIAARWLDIDRAHLAGRFRLLVALFFHAV